MLPIPAAGIIPQSFPIMPAVSAIDSDGEAAAWVIECEAAGWAEVPAAEAEVDEAELAQAAVSSVRAAAIAVAGRARFLVRCV
jgi:hypothetical protein